MDTLTTRLLITFGLVIAGLAAYAAYRWLIVRRAHGKRLGLEEARQGMATILYFTTPSCAPCRTMQAPALERILALSQGALQVIKIDAEARPEVADHWGVMSVPSTFVIDPAGKPRYFNPGVAPVEKLTHQLRQVGLNVNG